MTKMRDLTGYKAGYLTALSYAGNNCRGRAMWLCRCTCNNQKVILGDHLTRKSDSVVSCGCIQKANRIKHGAYLPNADIRFHIKYSLLQSLRDRAHRNKYESDLQIEDMPEIPDVCPVLGIPLSLYRKWSSGKGKGKGRNRHDNSPTIDRVNSNLPYLKKYKDNLCVISWRANKLKSDGVLSEFEGIVEYMRHRGIHNECESSLIDSKPFSIAAGNEAEGESRRERLSEKTLEV